MPLRYLNVKVSPNMIFPDADFSGFPEVTLLAISRKSLHFSQNCGSLKNNRNTKESFVSTNSNNQMKIFLILSSLFWLREIRSDGDSTCTRSALAKVKA